MRILARQAGHEGIENALDIGVDLLQRGIHALHIIGPALAVQARQVKGGGVLNAGQHLAQPVIGIGGKADFGARFAGIQARYVAQDVDAGAILGQDAQPAGLLFAADGRQPAAHAIHRQRLQGRGRAFILNQGNQPFRRAAAQQAIVHFKLGKIPHRQGKERRYAVQPGAALMEMADDAAQRLGEGIVADKDRIGRNLRAQQIKGVARTLAAFGLPAGKGQAAGIQHIAQTAQQLGLGGKGMAFQQRRRVAAAIGNGTAGHIAAQRVIVKAQGGRAGTGRALYKADVLHPCRRVGRAVVVQAGKRRRAGHHA